jgi:hypothetical protein
MRQGVTFMQNNIDRNVLSMNSLSIDTFSERVVGTQLAFKLSNAQDECNGSGGP